MLSNFVAILFALVWVGVGSDFLGRAVQKRSQVLAIPQWLSFGATSRKVWHGRLAGFGGDGGVDTILQDGGHVLHSAQGVYHVLQTLVGGDVVPTVSLHCLLLSSSLLPSPPTSVAGPPTSCLVGVGLRQGFLQTRVRG